jgi:glycosyltransferase involved in cell wall biosynthesis
MRIVVLTPSLPERGELLAEAVASVRMQTVRPAMHAIAIDFENAGIGALLNRLARSADVDWLARLDDDDLLQPNHLEALSTKAEDADVVYSWCEVAPRVVNGVLPAPPAVLGQTRRRPTQWFDEARLPAGNYIPATTLVRRTLWAELGGWREDGWRFGGERDDPALTEDWDFWLRALDAGARFVCVPEVTWIYRYHGNNLWLR